MRFNLVLVIAGVVAAALGLTVANELRSDFKIMTGESYQWQDFEGDYIFVNYFAEWCAPCIKEIPELNRFADYAETQPGLHLFAVSFDQLDQAQLQRVIEQYDIEFSVMQQAPKNAPFPAPKMLPATFIVSPSGEVIKQLQGEQDFAGLKEIFDRLQNI